MEHSGMNLPVCPKCGALQSAQAKFCSDCGTSLRPQSSGATASQQHCQSCGAMSGRDEAYCPKCGKPIALGPSSPPLATQGIQIQEYKRTCKACGRTWHSSVAIEKRLKVQGVTSNMMAATSIFNPLLNVVAIKNVRSIQGSLDKLKSCPDCGSHSYIETLVKY